MWKISKIDHSSTLSGWCSSKCRTVVDFWEHHPENVELFYFLEWCSISCPATLKRTQCSGRQQQCVQIHRPAQWIRNIRNSARDAAEKWLLNKDKEMDIRLGMTASILDEIFNDANLPIHYGPLCLQIQTALEALLNEVKQS